MRHFLALLVAVLFTALGAYGQTFRGAINGTVTDPTGAAVPGANVTATEAATSVAHTTVSTGDGQFSFQDIQPGTYKVTVSAAGFQQSTVSDIHVTAGNVFTVPVKLSVGQQTTTVEVAAAALTVDTTTAAQSDTIPSRRYRTFP